MRGSEHLRSYLSAITFWGTGSELRLVRDSGVGESGANEDAAIPALGGASAGARGQFISYFSACSASWDSGPATGIGSIFWSLLSSSSILV